MGSTNVDRGRGLQGSEGRGSEELGLPCTPSLWMCPGHTDWTNDGDGWKDGMSRPREGRDPREERTLQPVSDRETDPRQGLEKN